MEYIMCQNVTALEMYGRGFSGGSVVKNPAASAGDTVRALVQEDPTCCRTTKPVRHNY